MNLLDVLQQGQQELAMSKKKLAEPVREVAQIVTWKGGIHNVVRYVSMKAAQKQFEHLLDAMDKKLEAFALTGSGSSCYINNPATLDSVHLVDVEATNSLMADTQKRMNAMLNGPAPQPA